METTCRNSNFPPIFEFRAICKLPRTRKDSDRGHLCLRYAVVNNIPSSFRSRDLRRFFADFVEADLFDCFHFRHRPETKATSSNCDDEKLVPCGDQEDEQTSAIPSGSGDATAECEQSPTEAKRRRRKPATCCCVVRLTAANRERFVRRYNGRRWVDEAGRECALRCAVAAARSDGVETAGLVELRPPALMPRGNVGTASAHFLALVRQCRLPASLVGRLGLHAPPAPRYANVRLDYGASAAAADDDEDADNDDDELCEDWERHEALHDDVTDQERAKERLYEDEMEVVWEKGGPGLVWYTDAFAREIEEPDTDAKWADDWDVDMSVYYDRGAGDFDARQSLLVRGEKRHEANGMPSAFEKSGPATTSRKRRRSAGDWAQADTEAGQASGEDYGRRQLERQGWRRGEGLGRARDGRPTPVALQLAEDAQAPRQRAGLGYRGEPMQRFGLRRRPQPHSITTVYDDAALTDPQPSVLRRVEPTWNKHR